jgi:hypothetical protein
MAEEHPLCKAQVEHLGPAASPAVPVCNEVVSLTDHDTSPNAILEAAQRYSGPGGLSLLPIAADASKRPSFHRLPKVWDAKRGRLKFSWKLFQARRPTVDELLAWGSYPDRFGLAVLGGAVSGGAPGYGLEIMDFDTAELFIPWAEAVDRAAPGLVNRLVRIQSPRPGVHCYWRSRHWGGNVKLARAPATDAAGNPIRDKRTGKQKKITLIELKGEGGYCLVPPSPGACHRTGRPYRLLEGSPDLTQVPFVTPAERETLLNAARALNRWIEPARPARQLDVVRGGSGRPGDDFNNRAEWEAILEPHGWVAVGDGGGVTYWRRPGKADGVSATTGYCQSDDGDDLFHVFSSNAEPFEADETYSKFAAYALLECEGNFQQAARKLGGLGYGGGFQRPWSRS